MMLSTSATHSSALRRLATMMLFSSSSKVPFAYGILKKGVTIIDSDQSG
jgi:hypothetical protein